MNKTDKIEYYKKLIKRHGEDYVLRFLMSVIAELRQKAAEPKTGLEMTKRQ